MPEVLSRMSGRWNRLSSFTRLLAYAVAAILVLGLAAGIGIVAALMVSGNVSSPTGEKFRPEVSSPTGEHNKPAQPDQADTESTHQQYSDAKRGQAAPQDVQPTYVDEVGEIQAGSVDAFSDSHEKLLRYDALTSGDIEKLQADQAALKRFAGQAGTLSAPQKYEDHEDVFRSAIDRLYQATRLAYVLAADPLEATQADFDHYDQLVNEAAADLQRSNEILGRNYKTIEGVERVGTS
jgi:hypothetical protein